MTPILMTKEDLKGLGAPDLVYVREIRASDVLADVVEQVVGDDAVLRFDDAAEALYSAREWANEAQGRAVLVTGSITLVGDAIALATAQGWKPA